ncbi:hypothetical protein [Alkalilacustris brevis]|uniref:hypothetical protein n=1 Tax=Alkalilacustris brevis TaxID=2026338 RepID=UPI000E0D3661|nr:hypothetical protein [Alkalilacustris brevis]
MTPRLHTATPQPLPPRSGDDWSEVLEPGEKLLWQGRPHGGYLLRWGHVPLMLVGALFLAVAFSRTPEALAAWHNDDPARAEMAGTAAALGALGLFFLVQPSLADMLRRRGTAYALTDRRALIETSFMGIALLAWPITGDSPAIHQRGRPGSVWFAMHRPPRDLKSRLSSYGQSLRPRVIGFECLPEAEQVHALLQNVKRGTA